MSHLPGKGLQLFALKHIAKQDCQSTEGNFRRC